MNNVNHFLDNIVWHTLLGPHAGFSVGTKAIRRYVSGFPAIIGFADRDNPALHALVPYVEPGEQLYCDGWAGVTPPGWRIESEAVMVKMIVGETFPAVGKEPEAILLDPRHAPAALELASITRPGPFSLRTIELGEYVGVYEGGRLVAMAGARVCAGGFGEISGVCTHPDFQGRGLARRLVVELLRRQMQRRETPFLRVMRDNEGARGLYQRLGFRDYRESVVRVISRY